MVRDRRSWFIFVAAVLAVVVVAAALQPDGNPRPAYACTGGGPGPFQEYAVDADAVAVVQALSAGGSENAAPTVTPEPTPSGEWHPVEWNVSLEGIGTRLQVFEAIGSVPVEIEVDEGVRKDVEERLRFLEANPYFLTDCAPDRLVWRYEVGKTYLLFLNRDENGDWYTYVQWEVDGSDVLTGGAEYADGKPALAVPRPILDAYFPDVAAVYNNLPAPWDGWIVDQQRVPLDAVLDSVWSLRTGKFPTPSPNPSSTPAPINIAPPSVGDGGLADAE